jgi:hypothetical protein
MCHALASEQERKSSNQWREETIDLGFAFILIFSGDSSGLLPASLILSSADGCG